MQLLKSQNIRLMDVFLLGPFMIYAGAALMPKGRASKLMMMAGALTIAYNGQNYLIHKHGL